VPCTLVEEGDMADPKGAKVCDQQCWGEPGERGWSGDGCSV
jgi:hypothetical protein